LLSRYTVTNAMDSGPGSLRQAILDANAHPGRDRVAFAIPGEGLHTIRPESELPTITDPVVLDGYTQPGTRPNTARLGTDAVLRIELDGSRVPADPDEFDQLGGLRIITGRSAVRGLVINRFPGDGISIARVIPDDADGFEEVGGNAIEGNFIGTDATGTEARPNGVFYEEFGFRYGSGVAYQGLRGRIGGTNLAARNLISGNHGPGVSLGSIAETAQVLGNLIGTDATGTRALGNGASGVSIYLGHDHRIGGPVPGAGNVISGNGGAGVSISSIEASSRAEGHRVQGNYIGTDVTGTKALGNADSGVQTLEGEGGDGFLIGGTAPGAGNLISGNGRWGVFLSGTRSRVTGNRIGTDRAGRGRLGNARDGIRLINEGFDGEGRAAGNAAMGNSIAYNGGNGIAVAEGYDPGAIVRPNRVFGNAGRAVLRNAPEVFD
jgi:hypothetical protein